MKKKLIAGILTAAMAVGTLMGCGSGSAPESGSGSASKSGTEGASAAKEDDGAAGGGSDVETKRHKIVVFTLKATGSIVDGEEAIFASIADDLNIDYEIRFAGDDASTFLSNVETAIAEGFDGIISMTDKGNTAAILELCEENDVYFAMNWANLGTSLNSSDNGYDILKSDHFVGSITSCTDTYEEGTIAYCEQIAADYEALPDDKKEGSIGITTNPAKWTPAQQIAAQNVYTTLTEEYGVPDSAFATNTLSKRAEDTVYAGVTLEAGTWQFCEVDISSFSLPQAYFQGNPNMSLIVSWASITYIEPALQTAGLHGSVHVWTCGFESEDYLVNNFGTEGDQTYQGDLTAPLETTLYSLALILDKLNGYTYPDYEENVSSLIADWEGGNEGAKYQLSGYLVPYSSSIVITSSEEMDRFVNNYVYGNASSDSCIVSADDLKSLMMTYNADATFENLKAFFNETGALTMDAIQ